MKQEYITFSRSSISKTIEKPDVIIVYLNNGRECWLCDKNFKPVETEKTIRYKLATRD